MRKALFLLCCGALASCDSQGGVILGNLPVIEPVMPVWSAGDASFRFQAEVRTAAGGEPVPDTVAVSVVFNRALPPGQSPLPHIAAARRDPANPTRFSVDATSFGPYLDTQVVQFFWMAESTQSNGDLLRLAESPEQSFMVGCSGNVTNDQLAAEQTAVLARFGGVTTAANILAMGFVPTHGFACFRGMGVAFIRSDIAVDTVLSDDHIPQPGQPDLLFFAPNPAAPAAAVSEALVPDDPYTFIGWAYAGVVGPEPVASRFSPDNPFSLSRRPRLRCMIPYQEWMIHEAGVHTPDGGFDPEPPGTSHPFEPGISHPRLWDIHIWADTASGIPRLSILNEPTAGNPSPAAGIVAPEGSFFYPPMNP